MKTRKEHLREVYVWELPVRIYHWVNALCIVILCATGFIIADPFAIINATEATFSFWFGYVRLIHFITGFVFFFNFVVRLYWSVAGNRFARWNNFLLLKKSQWKEFFEIIKVDVLMIKTKPVESIGHNAVACFTYFGMFLAFLFQCITGFALYAQMSQAAFPKLFTWIIPLMGGELVVRDVHHLLMWFFILFSLAHVYLVIYHDYIERRGETSSMIGGWKFVEESIVEEEEKKDKAKREAKAGKTRIKSKKK